MSYAGMRTVLIVPSLFACMLHLGAVEAESFKGAEAILAAIATPAPAAPPAVDARPTKQEIAAFAARADRDAAGWLALAARWQGERMGIDAAASSELIAALPGPAAWPAVIAGLRAQADGAGDGEKARRRAAGWRLLAALLAGDRAQQAAAVAAVPADEGDQWTLRQAREALLDEEDDPEALVRTVEAQIALAAQAGAQSRLDLTLPDLVSLVGEERAAALLRSAFAVPFDEMKVHGTRTRALAARLAQAMVADLKSAPWDLCAGPAALELFPALEARFPAKGNDSWRLNRALAAYLTQLIAGGRTADAVARLLAAKDPDDVIGSLAWDDLAEKRPTELADTLRDLLKADPAKPLWSAYARLAGLLGRAAELRAMVRDHGAAAAAQGQLVDLLLAADEIEPAVIALRAGLAAAPPAAKPGDDEDGAGPSRDRRPESAERLIRLGLVLERPELVEEGCTALAGLPAKPASWGDASVERTALLLRAGRPVLAERLLEGELRAAPRQRWGVEPRAEQLAALVRLYAASGRPADALLVVDRATGWGAADLAQVNPGADAHEGRPPLAEVVAEALLAGGRREEALRCTLLALDQCLASDPAYALLLRLDPAGAPAVLARLQRRDALEDRPLLWLARLQLDGGDAATAAATARAAVDADPSDGDQGPEDRMRARTVLAEALEKLGRGDEAKPLRVAVSAIRAGEKADLLLRAGLASRAAEAYAKSLEIREKTYCVQSRLAVTLARLGRSAEAAVHFRRAFELMPIAFGRRESHCFGCEGVFAGVDARRIAEEVFTGLVAKEPGNAKHHYLLGYLRSEQERPAEAAEAFRTAIRLDPGYYSALSHLLLLDDDLRLPRAERQELTLALARLDPTKLHGDWQLGAIRDPAVLWKVLADASGDLRLAPEEVVALARPAKDPANPGFEGFSSYSFGGGRLTSPGAAIADLPLASAAAGFIDRDW